MKKKIDWSKSSHGKVVHCLVSIPEFNDLVLLARERLENICVEDTQFDTDYMGRPWAVMMFKMGVDDNSVIKRVQINTDKSYYIHISLVSDLLGDETVNRYVDSHFGVSKGKNMPVPTYNCKKENVLESFKETLNCHGQWLDRLKTEPRTALQDLKILSEFTRETMINTVKTTIASPEYAEGCKQARADLIVKDIREALSKHRDVTPEIIKRALDEYVVHEIMEN